MRLTIRRQLFNLIKRGENIPPPILVDAKATSEIYSHQITYHTHNIIHKVVSHTREYEPKFILTSYYTMENVLLRQSGMIWCDMMLTNVVIYIPRDTWHFFLLKLVYIHHLAPDNHTGDILVHPSRHFVRLIEFERNSTANVIMKCITCGAYMTTHYLHGCLLCERSVALCFDTLSPIKIDGVIPFWYTSNNQFGYEYYHSTNRKLNFSKWHWLWRVHVLANQTLL